MGMGDKWSSREEGWGCLEIGVGSSAVEESWKDPPGEVWTESLRVGMPVVHLETVFSRLLWGVWYVPKLLKFTSRIWARALLYTLSWLPPTPRKKLRAGGDLEPISPLGVYWSLGKGMEWVLGQVHLALRRLGRHTWLCVPYCMGCDCQLAKLIPEPPMK